MKEPELEEDEDAEKTRDEFTDQIERNRVASGLSRCFPFYLFVFPFGERRK